MTTSGEELLKKLGLASVARAYTLHAPNAYHSLLPSPIPLINVEELSDNTDWVQAFYFNKSTLTTEIGSLKHCLRKSGQLWISWPKKSSKVESDLSDSAVRHIGLNAGLVDVKVASINETWSGLKFVYRLTDR